MADLSKIRTLCKGKGITLKFLADNIDITQNSIQNIIKTNNTSLDTLEKICNFFEVPPTYFLNVKYEDEKEIENLKKRICELEKDRELFQKLLEKQ